MVGPRQQANTNHPLTRSPDPYSIRNSPSSLLNFRLRIQSNCRCGRRRSRCRRRRPRPSTLLRRPIKRNTVPAMTVHRRVLHNDEDCPDNFPCGDDVSPPLSQLLPLPPPPPCPPPPPVGEPYDGHHHLLVLLFVGSSVVAAFLLLSIVYFAVLRRRRRRGTFFFFPSAASDGNPPSDAGDVTPPAFDEAEVPLHHVWYIRTVGLDETTIEKIAVTEYKAAEALRAGDGDCSVCLGEFEDGDLVRLLPKCGHAFHVPCIDTWLRARINCPLCRAPVVDPDGAAAAVAAPPSRYSAGVPVVSGSSSSSDPDVTLVAQTQAAEEQTRTEGHEIVIDVGTAANTDEESSEGTSESPPESRALHGRSASMDSTLLDAVIVRLQPEAVVECSQEAKVHNSCGRQGSRVKDSVLRSLSTGGRAFFLYKHGRAAKNAVSPSLPL